MYEAKDEETAVRSSVMASMDDKDMRKVTWASLQLRTLPRIRALHRVVDANLSSSLRELGGIGNSLDFLESCLSPSYILSLEQRTHLLGSS